MPKESKKDAQGSVYTQCHPSPITMFNVMPHRVMITLAGIVRYWSIVCFLLGAVSPVSAEDPKIPPKRIILVTIDTLRADHLGLYGYPRNTSPHLDSLGARGVVFDHAIASSSHTSSAHASLFTSLHPYQHNVLGNGQSLDPKAFTLAQLLKSAGYHTAAFTSVHFLKHIAQGFDTVVPAANMAKFSIPSKVINDTVFKWLKQRPREENLFLWWHYWDPHDWKHRDLTLVNPPDRQFMDRMSRLTPEQTRQLVKFWSQHQGIESSYYNSSQELMVSAINTYDAQIANVDNSLKQMMRHFDTTGRNKETLWIITSDHGEGLGSHNYSEHSEVLYNEQLRAALLFYHSDPEVLKPARIDALVRHIDLMPTIANLLALKLPLAGSTIAGTSLAALLQGELLNAEIIPYALSQRRTTKAFEKDPTKLDNDQLISLQNKHYKYIYSSDGRNQFFDLAKDPLELDNIVRQPSAAKQKMRKIILEHVSQISRTEHNKKPKPLKKEQLKELKALGYL